jgi:hypothetical protein
MKAAVVKDEEPSSPPPAKAPKREGGASAGAAARGVGNDTASKTADKGNVRRGVGGGGGGNAGTCAFSLASSQMRFLFSRSETAGDVEVTGEAGEDWRSLPHQCYNCIKFRFTPQGGRELALANAGGCGNCW